MKNKDPITELGLAIWYSMVLLAAVLVFLFVGGPLSMFIERVTFGDNERPIGGLRTLLFVLTSLVPSIASVWLFRILRRSLRSRGGE
jgi:hypothetical protein